MHGIGNLGQFSLKLRELTMISWPSPLVLDYGYPVAGSAAEVVPYAIAVLVLVAATAAGLALRPRWGFLGLWFFAILAPTSSIVPLAGQTKAEHRMYLPLAAVVKIDTPGMDDKAAIAAMLKAQKKMSPDGPFLWLHSGDRPDAVEQFGHAG